MKLFRSLALATLATLAPFATTASLAQQAWPQKPVTFIIPFAAGGGTDAFARPLAAQLENQLGTRIVLENRAGAGGTVGASAAAKSAPDGYTFFIGAAHHAIAPALYPKLDYNIETDFAPIGLVASPPQVIVVHPGKVAAKSVQELIAFAKANPGKLNFGSAGNGTTHQLAGELFKLSTGTNLTHVPYRGGAQATTDTISGTVDFFVSTWPQVVSLVREGRLRALGIGAPARLPEAPNVPTFAELNAPDLAVDAWFGFWAPARTAPEIITRLSDTLLRILAEPAMRERLQGQGFVAAAMASAPFGEFQKAELARWRALVELTGIKLSG